MAFPVTKIDQPVANNGSATVAAGSLLVGFAATSGVVSVFDLNTETTSAWQMTSPSTSHALSNPASPWYDTATGLVWTVFSTSGTSALMFVSFNPVTGATNYYPTSQAAATGSRHVAVLGDYVVSFTGSRITRFDKSTGTVGATAWTGRGGGTRPWVYGNAVYMRYPGNSALGKYVPSTNAWAEPASGDVGIRAIASAQPVILGGKVYVTRSGGAGFVVTDLATETASSVTVASGFLGDALVLHDDGRLYSKPSNSKVGCWDPTTLEVASADHSGTTTYGVSHGGYVYFPAT